MRKLKFLFSLLMLICFSVGTWAASISVPSTVLDLTNPTTVTTGTWSGDVAYYLDNDVLITSGQESRLSTGTGKQTWITVASTGSSNNTWSATGPFKGSDYYSNKAYATLQASRYTAYLVTKCDSVWLYCKNSSTSKYMLMNIYDVTGSTATSIDDSSVSATYAVKNTSTTSEMILKQALDASKTYLIVTTGVGNSNSRVFEIAFFRNPGNKASVSVKKNGSAVTAIDFGEHIKGELGPLDTQFLFDTITLKQANLTDGISLQTNTAMFSVEPTSIALADWDSNGEKKVSVAAQTGAAGNFNGKITISSSKSAPEFTAIEIPLSIKNLGAEVVVVNNSTREPLEEINFGNVGQQEQKTYTFGLNCQRLEEGELTLTVSDGFNFFNGTQSETIDVENGSDAISNISIRQNTTDVTEITDGTLTITGGGIVGSVVVPVKMNVKAPEVYVSTDEIDFGDVKQNYGINYGFAYGVEETITVTAKYLSYGIGLNVSSSDFFAMGSNETKWIYPDENGEINETVTVIAYTNRTVGSRQGVLSISSSAVIDEFDEFDAVDLKINITSSFKVIVQADDVERVKIHVDGYAGGIDSDNYGQVELYVDENDEYYITATGKPGYSFDHWSATTGITVNNTSYSTTKFSATQAGTITANATFNCAALPGPKLYWNPEVTYNSASIWWEPVHDATAYQLDVWNTTTEEIMFSDEVTGTDAHDSGKEYLVDGLEGETEYTFSIKAITDNGDYCATDNYVSQKTFTTDDYPAAQLTLSENGITHVFSGSYKVADNITLPSTVTTEVIGKVLVGWSSVEIATPTDTKPGAATFWEKGASYVIQSTADKLYAVYATETAAPTTDHDVFAASDLGKSTITITTNFSASVNGLTKKTDSGDASITWYQESGNAGDVDWIQIKDNDHQIIPEQPHSIVLTAKIGAGSTKDVLDNPVYALLMNGSGNQLGDEVILTQTITDKYGTEFSANLPTTYYEDVRGIDIYHTKENKSGSGYNLRYFEIKMKYLTGGELSYSGYVTQGARILDNPTFSPAAGTYTTAQNITISANEGDIHYTINGADPTSASAEYTAAIALDEYGTYTIKAKAIDGDNASEVASSTYFMNLPFASLQDLVDANLPATGTEDVTVSFSSIAIDSIKNSSKSVYLHVLADGKGIYIYNGAAACPTTWEVDGRLSGTITGKWIKFNDKEWEIVPNSGFAWTDLTYTQASVSATPNTLNLGNIKQNFGSLSKTFTLSGEGVTKSVKLTTNSIRLSVSPSVVSATDVLAGKEITVTGTSSWSGDQEYTVSVATEEAPYEVVATNLVTVSWSVTPTNIVYVTTNNTAYGTVKINSSTSGQWAVTATEEFTLDATALSGYEFDKWTTDDDSRVTIADINDASTTAVATGSVTITANFKKIPVGVLTLSKNVIDFGIVKKGTSVSSQLFTLSGTGFTPGNTISLSFTGTDDYYGLSNDEYTADSEGKISEKSVTVLVDNTATASYGSKDCSLKISGDDLASDSIVAIKLTVGEEIVVPTITGGSLTWDGGVAPSAAVVGSEHTLAAVPASGYTGGEIAILKAEDDSDVTDDVMSGSTLTVPSYAIKVVVSGFEATAHPSGLGWRYGGEDVTTHSHTFGASTERFYFPSLKNPNEIDLDDIEFVSSDSTVAEFGARTHEYSSWFAAVWVKKAGTAVMTARLKNHATYDDIEVSYTLTVSKGELADNQFRWFQYPDIYSPESDTYTWYESHNWPYINASSTYVDKANEVTYESTNTAVATISSTGSITPVANGSTVIKAKFIGNDMFNAKTVQFTLNVQKANPVLSWSTTPTTSNTTVDLADSYGIYTFPRFGSVSPYVDALKDLVVLSSSNTAVAEINSNGYVNPLSAGTTTIKLSLDATDKSNAAEDISYTFTVNDSRPTLTIVAGDHGTYAVKDYYSGSAYESGAKVKASTYMYLNYLSVETGYKVPPVYKVVKTSDNTDVTLSVLNGTYLTMPAYDITVSATFPEKAVAPIGWSSTETQYAYTDDRAYTLPTLVNAGLSVTITSSNTNVATYSNGQVTVLSAGTTNISVSYAGDNTYKQTTVSYELVVRSPNHLNVKGQPTKLMYDYGETINFTGMTATLYYDAEKTDGVDVTSVATWSSTPATVTASGYMTLTASYKGKQDSRLEYIYLKQYEVIFSNPANAHGTIVVKQNGTAISSHDAFPKGTVLTIEATPDADYKLATLTANGDDIMATKQFTIGTTEVTIAATFDMKLDADISWSTTAIVYAYTDGSQTTVWPTIENPHNIEGVTCRSSNVQVATVDNNGNVTILKDGIIFIWVEVKNNEDYKDASVSYTLRVCAPDHILISEWSSHQVSYEYGDNFNFNGFKAELYYNNYGGKRDVTEEAVWTTDPATITEDGNITVNATVGAITGSVSNVYVVVKKHTIAINSATHGSIVVKYGDNVVANGDKFVKGTELTVSVVPETGYELNTLKANGNDIEVGSFIVQTANVTFTATFKQSGATALDEAAVEADGARKVIIDSKLFIIRGDKMFDAQGKLVK